MVFKPKKKLPKSEVQIDDLKSTKLAEIKKKIKEAEAEVADIEKAEDDYEDEDEVEEESEEVESEEVEEDEPPEIEEKKSVNEEISEPKLKLTAEEVVTAIEFNIARAGQLLQLLK